MNSVVVAINIKSEGKLLSKAQKEFNRLTDKIEKIQFEIRNLETGIPKLMQRASEELEPIRQARLDVIADIVRVFDRSRTHTKYNKTEIKKIGHYIEVQAFELISQNKERYSDLIEIHDKYASNKAEQALENAKIDEKEMMLFMLKMMGLEVDDEDIDNPEILQEKLFKQMQNQQAKQEEETMRRAKKREERPRTAKQIAQENKRKEEERKTTQSVREIYLDLVKNFHPDLVQDKAEKERRHNIMQQVTSAYDNGDLVQLLQLQLQFERIDKDKLDSLTDEKLKYFNKVLKSQLSELEVQYSNWMSELEMFYDGSNPYGHKLVSLETAVYLFEKDVEDEKKSLSDCKKSLEIWRSSTDAIKLFLKSYKIKRREDDFFL